MEAPKPAPSKPTAAPKKRSNTRDVNALLNQLNNKGGGNSKGGKPAESGSSDPSLPPKLGASAVRSALRKKQGIFQGCKKKHGVPGLGSVVVKTSFTIASSGAVKKATVLQGAGTSAQLQACVVKALKGTRFPRFRDPQMTVNYPISLR